MYIFFFSGQYYLQIFGAVMGSTVSHMSATCTFRILRDMCWNSAQAQESTDHMNSIDEDIKWTAKMEVPSHTQNEEEVNIDTRTERALAFLILNIWSVVKEDGSINTKVYHKETHTDQYSHFSSNHPIRAEERGSEDSDAQSGHYSE